MRDRTVVFQNESSRDDRVSGYRGVRKMIYTKRPKRLIKGAFVSNEIEPRLEYCCRGGITERNSLATSGPDGKPIFIYIAKPSNTLLIGFFSFCPHGAMLVCIWDGRTHRIKRNF